MTVDRAYCLACCVPVASCECRPGDAIAGLEVTELKVETIELAVPPDVDAERSQFQAIERLRSILLAGGAIAAPDQVRAAVADAINLIQAAIFDGRALRALARYERDGAYSERNQLVALLARLFPSGIARTPIDGWDPAWFGCVYVDLPTGQASWHFHDSEAHLFAGLPPYPRPWDGHSTPQKYKRIAELRDRLQLGDTGHCSTADGSPSAPPPAGTSEAPQGAKA